MIRSLIIAAFILLAFVPASAQSPAQTCGDPNATPDQAIAACTKLIASGAATGSNLAIAYGNRGASYINKGQLDEAITDFTQALKASPSFTPAYLQRAIAYTRKSQPDLAIADYTQVIRLDPKSADAYYHRGLVYQNKGQNDLAIADYTQALRIEPGNATTYYYRGLAYHEKGQNDLAAADFNQALRINPNLSPARSALQGLQAR